MRTITPIELNALHDKVSNLALVDVRTPAEFRDAHIAFARSIPLHELTEKWFASNQMDSSQTTYLICQSDARARKAAILFASRTGNNVVVVEGGMNGWNESGLPTLRGKKVISMERQVRITAGLIVATGITLAILIHPWFAAMSAFVGAGLIFSGITDTCGLGVLLSRMPWNK